MGVISDSFDLNNQLQNKIFWGELPGDIIVLAEASSCSNCRNEGRMMMEVIYDTAPQAKLMFHTAFGGPLVHAQAIKNLATNGSEVSVAKLRYACWIQLLTIIIQIIVDDIVYLSEPWFQPGPVYKAIDALDASVVYITSAGNFGKQALQQQFQVNQTQSKTFQ